MDADGHVNKPRQPAFCEKATGYNDPTIVGATYKIPYHGNERFDVTSDFNESTYTFTAPVTGKYMFTASVRGDSYWDRNADYFQLMLETSNQSYTLGLFDPDIFDQNAQYYQFGGSVLADMDASDTAYVRLYQSSGGNELNIVGDGTWFSGYLAC